MVGKLFLVGLLACRVAVGQAPAESGVAAPAATSTAAASAARSFDVASVRPSARLDPQAMMAAMRDGKMPKFGPNVEGLHAQYNQMQLRDLVAYAYGVRTYQVSGPDTLTGQRFDIAARMPEGSAETDAPAMMRALLVERFKLEVTTKTEDRPVLALGVGKSGPKMKQVHAPAPLDLQAELKPGEQKIDTLDGPAIVLVRLGSGPGSFSQTTNMGSKGSMSASGGMDGQSFNMHMTFSGVTMNGLAAMLSQFMTQLPGSAGNAKPVVDKTGLTGNYDTALDFSAQVNMGGGGPGGGGGAQGGAPAASDPGANGSSSIYDSVQKMGLKLESSKAPVEQVVVTHVEKMPTEN